MAGVMENLNVKIDADEKREFTEIARSLGTTPSNAVRMFVRAFNDYAGFPFDLRQPRYNAETEAAMVEARGIADGTIPAKRYSSAAEMIDDILAEDSINA